MTADRKKGILSASLGSILWGSSGIAGQFLLINENIAPEWLTFFRLFCAGFLVSGPRHRGTRDQNRDRGAGGLVHRPRR